MEEKFGVVVAMGLAIFGLAFVANSADLDFIDTSEQDTESVFIDKSYDKIGESNPDDRVIEFGDFPVGEARGNIRAYRNDRASISDSLFSLFGGEKIVFRYNATQPETGNVSFEVLGREGKGDVYVEVNDRRLYSEPLIATGSPRIEVPQTALKPGINRFEIGVERNSFFGSTEYALEEVETRVNDRKFHDYEDNFQVYSYELQDYVESPLTFTITKSLKASPLEIIINDQTVYSKDQVRSQNEVEITPRNANLTPGSNEITFSTDKPSRYDIENAQMTIRYIGNVERQNIEFDFPINNNQLDLVNNDDTTEYISFEYQNLLPSPRPVDIKLNDYQETLNPRNGENSIELEEGVIQQENSFSFRSNGTYQLDKLRIYTEGEE
ncbi:MAG: hypothetical protein BRC29_01035 [Nanohaloarchaea archaeon SW_7_43_1]|nr:MAG: hypothetical protein BRC29_01035 [Nanohaloarchaea archaeon SW_7_43_1]